MAGIKPSLMAICIVAMLSVPNGSDPKKLMNKPVKSIRISFVILLQT
jgi:hypothetical protein